MLPCGRRERFTRIRNEFGTIVVGEEAWLALQVWFQLRTAGGS